MLFLSFDPVTTASLDIWPGFVFKPDHNVNMMLFSGSCFTNSIFLQNMGQGYVYWHNSGSEMSQKHEVVQLALFITAPFLLSRLFHMKATRLRVKFVWELTGMSSAICSRVDNVLQKLFLPNFHETLKFELETGEPDGWPKEFKAMREQVLIH